MAINQVQGINTTSTGSGYAPAYQRTPDPIVSTAGATTTQTYQAVQPVQETTAPTKENVQFAVEQLNNFTTAISAKLNFQTDEDTGMTIVKVIDTESDKVIRQIPTEEAVQIAKSLDKLRGLLLNDKA